MSKKSQPPESHPQKNQTPGTKVGPNGKYLLIDVPNFNGARKPEEQMRSYLRLGAVDPEIAGNKAKSEWGEDLAVKAKKPTRLDGVTDGDPDDAQRSQPFDGDQDIVFEDDVRTRDPSDGSWSVERRLEESENLHKKGGWRDHSDGNRITTTRGDKVEVIRGNYKLVVIGRQNKEVGDDHDDLAGIAAGFDISGGEVRGMGMNLGEFETTSVQWIEDKGRYRFVEKNQKGDTYSIYWGDTHEEFFGEWKVDITGSEDPSSYPHEVPDAGRQAVNPKIVSKTWAESIEEYTGSASKRVPSIKSETWVEDVIELTDVLHGTASNTRIGGGTAEATTIGGGTVSATTIGGATVESTIVGLGTASSTIVGGGTADLSIVGLGTASLSIVGIGTAELSLVGVSANSLSIVPTTNELSIGDVASLAVGNELGMRVGNTVGLQAGTDTSVFVGTKSALDIATMFELYIGLKCSIMLGPYIDLKLDKMNLITTETKLGAKLAKMGFKIDEG